MWSQLLVSVITYNKGNNSATNYSVAHCCVPVTMYIYMYMQIHKECKSVQVNEKSFDLKEGI